ncbi:alkaline phosphatase [Anthocerotibacter panamensis]|uniref:alkaline phosphatase n=1 Tax=Anthocerotibacter panamensis TaxID=2857077 RepID=UPI001C403B9A|nr:alkaline phosphatase [Anthocerotibacter panamensis]
MKALFWKRASLVLAATLALVPLAAPVLAGPDDDARFRQNGTTRNSVDPIQSGGLLADFPTNAEPNTGLRIMPPTETQLIVGQRFDLRVETQVPGATAPTLVSLTVNGTDITASFNAKVAAQGAGLESGNQGLATTLYGNTVRNMSFSAPGSYTVTATVNVGGTNRTITNNYRVASYAFRGNVKHVVFFLGDALGLPVRSAARIVGKGIFEGRGNGKLNMDAMDEYGLVHTSSFDSVITDSAPGMANYVTGLKQPNNGLNVSPDNTPDQTLDNPRIETLWEFMKRTQGWKTGVVSDAFITDATPAAGAAHTRNRGDRRAIAQQFLDFYQDGTAQPLTGYAGLRELTQPLDVILGSGAIDFLGTTTLTPGSNISTFYQYSATSGRTDVDLVSLATGLGYATPKTLAELNSAPNNQPILGLFTGEFRTTSSGLGTDNIPGVLDRLVALGQATIQGRGASDPLLGMTGAPPNGTGCGATIRDCFAAVPSKPQMVTKAMTVLNNLAGPSGGWMLMVEQSQTDKLGHPLEYERVVYEALELDNTLGGVISSPTFRNRDTLVVLSADHAQPETIIGVALPGSIVAGGATPSGGCFTPSTTYPITLGSAADTQRPCPLQDVVGTFNDGTFPTYTDANGDGYPDESDPTVKLILEDGGRPTYTQNYLTNFQPLNPAGSNAAFPNPARDPDGLLLTGNLPTRNVVQGPSPLSASSANKTNGNTGVAPHSGEDVPLSASGPGADLFAGVYENTDVHVRIASALSGRTSRRSLNLGTPFTGVPNATPPGSNLSGF